MLASFLQENCLEQEQKEEAREIVQTVVFYYQYNYLQNIFLPPFNPLKRSLLHILQNNQTRVHLFDVPSITFSVMCKTVVRVTDMPRIERS